jgi:hypothetical protein
VIFLRYSGLGATGALLHSVSLGGEPLKPLNVRRAVVDAGVGSNIWGWKQHLGLDLWKCVIFRRLVCLLLFIC